jgi:hypothetical protein
MTQDEFPDDLIRHCEQQALEAVASDTAGLVRAVLRASGYAELVAALELSRPFVRIAATQKQADASSRWYDKAVAALAAIDDVLAAAAHKQGSGK